jgi:uncharacterized protein (DUF433 family)
MEKERKRAMARKNFREHQVGRYRVREISEYIIAHQGICHGQPTFRGTRVMVHLALESLKEPGQTIQTVADDYGLPVEAVADALRVAADLFCNHLRLPNPWGEPDEPTAVVTSTRVPRRRNPSGHGDG